MWKRFRNTNYLVNEEGIVKHITKNTIRQPYKGEYLRLTLYENKKQFSINVHDIVAELYLDPVENTTCINHKDGNKYNNHKDNLERSTQSENIQHAYDNDLTNATGINNGRAKLTEENVINIRKLKSNTTSKKLAEQFNVSVNTIKDIISRRNWKHI